MSRAVLHNAFCDAWGIEVPIFLAGMGVGGRATPPALVAAVSQAGGLGVIGCSGLSPEETRRRIRAVRALTDKPFGVDLLLPARIADAPHTRTAVRDEIRARFPKHAAFVQELIRHYGLPDVKPADETVVNIEYAKSVLEVIFDERVPVFAAGLGDPDFLLERARAQGAAGWSVRRRIAEELAFARQFDVALVDLVMPGMDGVATTRAIKDASPRTQVIILTSFDEDSQALPAIEAGAISYLLKDVSGDELADAVRKAAHGEAVLHARVAGRLVDALRNRPPRSQDVLATLSQREREVLNLVAQGMSNQLIAEKLEIGEKTVKSHVSNILGKLHVADRTQAAVFAWRRGLVRDEPAR